MPKYAVQGTMKRSGMFTSQEIENFMKEVEQLEKNKAS